MSKKSFIQEKNILKVSFFIIHLLDQVFDNQLLQSNAICQTVEKMMSFDKNNLHDRPFSSRNTVVEIYITYSNTLLWAFAARNFVLLSKFSLNDKTEYFLPTIDNWENFREIKTRLTANNQENYIIIKRSLNMIINTSSFKFN